MSKTRTSARFRSCVVTIQTFDIFRKIIWSSIPKLKRATLQMEDKDLNGNKTEKVHIQAFLEFTETVYATPLRKYLPNVHLPTYTELQELKVRFPKGMDPQWGRNYCSNPIKRVDFSVPWVWENNQWTQGADFITACLNYPLREEMPFQLNEDKPRNSFLIPDDTEGWVEVLEIGTEVLRPSDTCARVRNAHFLRTGQILPLHPPKGFIKKNN